MSANAGIHPGHALTSAPNPPAPTPPFTPGDPLFNVVNVAAPYQAVAGDLVVTTSDAVTTPVAPTSGTYFAVKNVGAEIVEIVGTVDGGTDYVIYPSPVADAQPATWFVWNDVRATWEAIANFNAPGVMWIWADAAARTAENPPQIFAGRLGYQTDIRAFYQLAVSPSLIRWLRMPDGAAGTWNGCNASANTSNGFSFTGTTQALFGTATARACTETNNATRLAREGLLTGALAGNTAARRAAQATTSGVHGSGGWRQNWRGVIAATGAPSMVWFMGTTTSAPAINVNTDPVAFINTLGIGRTFAVEANVQLLWNDGAGTCSQLDLGASFPHGDNEGYELELYTQDGVTYSYQVTNLNTLAQTSGILTTNIPTAIVNTCKWTWYASNNLNAVQVSLDQANYSMWQQQYAL
jgi:hypothetical protein